MAPPYSFNGQREQEVFPWITPRVGAGFFCGQFIKLRKTCLTLSSSPSTEELSSITRSAPSETSVLWGIWKARKPVPFPLKSREPG